MSASSPKRLSHPNQTPTHNREHEDNKSACDYCGNSRALLYCRADSAKLCFTCDREVHSTNQLFSKHTRVLLCDSCNHSPASILCSTESSVLCQNCDWERHNLSLSPVHERGPLEGFTGCPSVTELLTIVGFEDIGKKALLSDEGSAGCGVNGDGFIGCEIEGISDLFVWDAPSVVSLDDLISSSGSSHNFQAMEVPPLPKNRKAACGRHKEEILSQLRELAKCEPLDPEQQYLQSRNLSTDLERDLKADDLFPDDLFPSYEWHRESYEAINQVVPSDMSLRYSMKGNNEAKHSTSSVWETHTHTYDNNEAKQPSISLKSESLSTTPKAAPCELTSQERDSALLRYKEKKKTRRYDKHIRYESRKVRAQSRTRVKGRFAKMEH